MCVCALRAYTQWLTIYQNFFFAIAALQCTFQQLQKKNKKEPKKINMNAKAEFKHFVAGPTHQFSA